MTNETNETAPATEATPTTLLAVPAPAKEAKPKRKKKPAATSGAPGKTLADLAEGYLKHLEDEGKSHGTCFSYSMEMRAACAELGEKTKLSTLTPKKVLGFYESDRVTLLKSGKPKSQLSIDKTRRVLRLALVWAAGENWIEKAPLPDMKPAK